MTDMPVAQDLISSNGASQSNVVQLNGRSGDAASAFARNSLSPAQCRAARALLRWSQIRLAREAVTCRKTISDFEQEKRGCQRRTVMQVAIALSGAGIEFGDGEGVRFKQASREAVRSDGALTII